MGPDRLAALAEVDWPADASEVASWEASPPDWLVEIRRREAAKAAGTKGGNRRRAAEGNATEARAGTASSPDEARLLAEILEASRAELDWLKEH